MRVRLAPLVALATLLAACTGLAQAATPVSYSYDAAGRLASVTDGAGQTATYHYDRDGNVLSVTHSGPARRGLGRRTTPAGEWLDAPHIRAAGPARVASGGTVVIAGHGFSTNPNADIVRVGALIAPVRQATADRLVVTAPPGSGGAVTVTTPGGAARGPSVEVGSPSPAPALGPLLDIHPLRAAPGVTALSGLVAQSSGKPLARVRLTVTGRHGSRLGSAVSDRTGHFLISHLPSGRLELAIDGDHVRGFRRYGFYVEPVELPAARTTVLPWTTYLTPLDVAHAITIASPTTRSITLTNPRLPGLRVEIPKGTVIRDHSGRIVHRLSLTWLPTDRTPMPWGPGMAPQYFTLQPGHARVSGPGLRIIYPNHTGQTPGAAVPYLTESPDWPGTGWWRYGTGHVSANGREIVPDRGTVYRELDPGGATAEPAPSPDGPPCDCGDPVNLSTGLWTHTENDLTLRDVEPVTLSRTFRQNDDMIRDFGIGMSDSFNLYVIVDNNGNDELVLPSGFQIVYVPSSTTGVYRAVNTPTEFVDSTLTDQNGDPDGPLSIALTDGTVLQFGNPAYLTQVTDRFGNSITITRVNAGVSGVGTMGSVTTPDGRWLRFTYGTCVTTPTPTTCVTRVQDNSGRTVSYTYDRYGRLTQVIGAGGGRTSYAWAACTSQLTCTELLTVTDPDGHTVETNAYDSTTGRVTSQTAGDGAKWSYTYTTEASGNVTDTTVTDPRGVKYAFAFDSSGYPTAATAAVGTPVAETTTLTYDPNTHLITGETDPLGRKTTFTYDSRGNLLTQARLAGTATPSTYMLTYEPKYSRITSVTDPLHHTFSIAYDDAARTESLTDALGHSWVVTLSQTGEPVKVSDPLGHATYLSYRLNDLVAVSNPLGQVTSAFYDQLGRPIALTDAKGNVTQQSWTPLDELGTQTDALGNVTRIGYDADGNPTSLTDADGHTTTFAYDVMSRLVKQTDPLGRADTYTYDGLGDELTHIDRNGTLTAYTYDPLDRLSLVGFGVSGSTAQSTIAASYDLGDRLVKAVDSAAGTYGFSYDGLGDVLSATGPQGNVTYTYDLAGRRTAMTAPHQSTVDYTYDAGNELTRVTQGSSTVTMSYDADSRPSSLTLPDGIKQTAGYDAASEPTSLTFTHAGASLGALDYAYDADGRVTSVSGNFGATGLPAAITSATYNADNELVKQGTTTYTYSKDGDLVSDGANTYAWNAREQLTAIAGATTASFTYDPFDRRASSTLSGKTSSYLYDGSNVIQQLSAGTPTENLLTGGTGQVFQLTTPGGENSSFLTDVRGSTIGLGNAAGTVATKYTYDPGGVASASGAATSNRFDFIGALNDGTGLYAMGARYYSPGLGRFISQDPLSFGGSDSNLYQYASSDPIDFSDPSGLTDAGTPQGQPAPAAPESGGFSAWAASNWSTISTGAGAVASWIGGDVKFAWDFWKSAFGFEQKAEDAAQTAIDVSDAMKANDRGQSLGKCLLKMVGKILPFPLTDPKTGAAVLDKGADTMQNQQFNGTIHEGGDGRQSLPDIMNHTNGD
jgi:RHS repeat-associated protein